MNKKYNHIFFDLDQTLWDFDTNAGDVLTDIYSRFELQKAGIPEISHFICTYKQINASMWADYSKGTITKEFLRVGRYLRTLAAYGVEGDDLAVTMADYYVSECPKKSMLFPYVREILAYLHPKYHLHIITNGFEEVQNIKLNACNLNQYFKNVVTSDQAGFKKPDTGIFRYALRKANASAAYSVMVGDQVEVDIIGARNSGMDQIFFDPSGGKQKGAATYNIKCMSELMKIL